MNQKELERLWYGQIEYEPTVDDVKWLIWHYENLHDSTELLVAACSQRNVTVIEGFREVCERLVNLRAQLAKMEGAK